MNELHNLYCLHTEKKFSMNVYTIHFLLINFFKIFNSFLTYTIFLETLLEIFRHKKNLKKQAKSKANKAYYLKRKTRNRQVHFFDCLYIDCLSNFLLLLSETSRKREFIARSSRQIQKLVKKKMGSIYKIS